MDPREATWFSGVDPLWFSRQALPLKRTMVIHLPHRMAQIYPRVWRIIHKPPGLSDQFICTLQMKPNALPARQFSLQPLQSLPCCSGIVPSILSNLLVHFTVVFIGECIAFKSLNPSVDLTTPGYLQWMVMCMWVCLHSFLLPAGRFRWLQTTQVCSFS